MSTIEQQLEVASDNLSMAITEWRQLAGRTEPNKTDVDLFRARHAVLAKIHRARQACFTAESALQTELLKL